MPTILAWRRAGKIGKRQHSKPGGDSLSIVSAEVFILLFHISSLVVYEGNSRGARIGALNRCLHSPFMLIFNAVLGSSMVEHPAVNRRVTGSSPVRGEKEKTPIGVFSFSLLAPKGENL